MDEVHSDGGNREKPRAGGGGPGCFAWVPQFMTLPSQVTLVSHVHLATKAGSDGGRGSRIQNSNSSSP